MINHILASLGTYKDDESALVNILRRHLDILTRGGYSDELHTLLNDEIINLGLDRQDKSLVTVAYDAIIISRSKESIRILMRDTSTSRYETINNEVVVW